MENKENINFNREISNDVKILFIQEFKKSSYIHLNDFFLSLLNINFNNQNIPNNLEYEEIDLINNLDISVKKIIINAYKKSLEKKISVFLLKCIKNVPVKFRKKIEGNSLEKLKFMRIKSYSNQIETILSQMGVENEEIDNFLKEIISNCTRGISPN